MLESDTSLLGAEKEKLLLELSNKETALKKEKAEQDTIKLKLEAMESKLLSGKGAILQGTIHILRKHLSSTKLDLTT